MGGAPILQPSSLDISKIKGKTVWAVGAHSDDLEFGAAGTLMQLSQENRVVITVATDGQMGTHDLNQDQRKLIEMRMKEARASAERMGAQEMDFWNYPDMELQNRKKHLMRRVAKKLLKVRPDIVITFDPWGRYDAAVHPDHRTLSMTVVETVMFATLPKWLKRHNFQSKILSPKPKVMLMAPAEANVAVDVTSVWQERLAIVKAFMSQFDQEVQWQSVENWLSREYGRMGQTVNVDFAEGFRILEYGGEWDSNK